MTLCVKDPFIHSCFVIKAESRFNVHFFFFPKFEGLGTTFFFLGGGGRGERRGSFQILQICILDFFFSFFISYALLRYSSKTLKVNGNFNRDIRSSK